MKTVEQVRKEALTLSANERARLARALIISLDAPARCGAGPEQEATIRKRVRMVKQGQAVGRPAEQVFAEIEAKLK